MPPSTLDLTARVLLDVISMYCFGRSLGALDRPDLGRKWSDLIHMGIKMNPFARAFPFIARRMLLLPEWMTNWSASFMGATEFLDLANDLTRTAMDEALADKASGKLSSTAEDDPNQRTVLHSMIQSDTLPENEKTFTRLANDSLVLIAAGYVTTSSTLAQTLFHILTKDDVRTRLVAELRRTVMPSPTSPLPSVAELEQLPYLTAVVHEGTRIAHGVPGRLVRIAPDEDLHYRSRDGRFAYRIPSGTTFSQSTYLAHTNEDIYPRPFEFEPERYYREPASGGDGDEKQPTEAQRRLVPFGKGTRQCAATNLAFAELYLAIAAVVGTLEMEVAPGITAKDARIASEFFAGILPDKPGIRVNVIGELKA
ncbi:cytochrome P450 [Chaetomium sp. MPI-CAGE-AT-0009]|nr:cytochrome P450 [Chaetomium sp. MPI-CAGE-AT-0009]